MSTATAFAFNKNYGDVEQVAHLLGRDHGWLGVVHAGYWAPDDGKPSDEGGGYTG